MATQDSEAGGGARVLVVEDDVHLRDLVVLHLQLEGLTAISAGTGSEGLRLAKADPFDLLILDLMLPELDGVTVCRAVRREAMNGDVPILMLTSSSRRRRTSWRRSSAISWIWRGSREAAIRCGWTG